MWMDPATPLACRGACPEVCAAKSPALLLARGRAGCFDWALDNGGPARNGDPSGKYAQAARIKVVFFGLPRLLWARRMPRPKHAA